MKTRLSLLTWKSFHAAALLVAATFSLHADPIVVNIDFLAGNRTDSLTTNYGGSGPAGGGAIYNGVLADDRDVTTGTGSFRDNITVTGTDLLTSTGAATGIGFTVAPVAADNNPGPLDTLNGGYLYLNGDFNSPSSVPFTFSGLAANSLATVYLTTANYPQYAVSTLSFDSGGSSIPYAGAVSSGGYAFTSANTLEYQVTVGADGTIDGNFNAPSTAVFSALTVVGIAAVPEPSTTAALVIGAATLAIAAHFRRRKA